MYAKSFLLFICLFICASCTTFHYYYPSHEFKERVYNPVKKGLVELNIHKENNLFRAAGTYHEPEYCSQ